VRKERAETVQPGEEEAQGDLISALKYLKKGCTEVRSRLLSVVPSARTGGSGHKLAHRKFLLTTKSTAVLCR